MKSPRLNVRKEYKGLTIPQIKEKIVRYPVALASYCVQYDINIGCMMRNSNVFACSNFVMVGKKKWDRRAAIGTQNYENIVHCKDWEALLLWMRAANYTLVGVDYEPGISVPINEIETYPAKTLFLMGSERSGIPPLILDACEIVVHIKQFGCARSLNVATASGIILNDWHNKYA